jgi:hypothetical protein
LPILHPCLLQRAAAFVRVNSANLFSGDRRSMAPRATLFEYRAWPEDASPYNSALRGIFGYGVSDFTTDTYILHPSRPLWVIIIRGGAYLELKVRTGVQWPVSAWRSPLVSPFPLRPGIARTLQAAFPRADLPERNLTAEVLRARLRPHVFMCTVSKRIVRLRRGNCSAEMTQVDAEGYRADNFALTGKQCAPVAQMLAALPQPRLPNLDYGAWLQCRVLGRPPVALISANDQRAAF